MTKTRKQHCSRRIRCFNSKRPIQPRSCKVCKLHTRKTWVFIQKLEITSTKQGQLWTKITSQFFIFTASFSNIYMVPFSTKKLLQSIFFLLKIKNWICRNFSSEVSVDVYHLKIFWQNFFLTQIFGTKQFNAVLRYLQCLQTLFLSTLTHEQLTDSE